MIAIAHFFAISLYLAAAALAATPFARPVNAPVRGVVGLLSAGVAVHLAALITLAVRSGHVYVAGLGPSLSLAGFVLAATLLIAEVLAHEVSLTLVTAPLAAVATVFANVTGFARAAEPSGAQGAWLMTHIALSFIGIAAFGTAAAAGLMYLVERRELKSGRFDAMFRLFPPLATLDRVNHLAALVGWLGLTVGVVLAVAYSLEYGGMRPEQLVWGIAAWLGVTNFFQMGGAQAIAALAFGTATVPRVDRIVGPGNIYVAAAKKLIAGETGIDFVESDNHFQAQATLDNVVAASGALRSLAVSLNKIAADIRLLGCGPRAGIAELEIPAVQPGSSIMPGKVNPVILESMTMVAAQVIGNDATVAFAGATGSLLELNVMMPVAAYNLLQAISLLAAGATNVATRCVDGLRATENGPAAVERGLMTGTGLTPRIGYDATAAIAKEAHASGRTVREVARERTDLTEEELRELLDPESMTTPGRAAAGTG